MAKFDMLSILGTIASLPLKDLEVVSGVSDKQELHDMAEDFFDYATDNFLKRKDWGNWLDVWESYSNGE